MGLYRNTDTNDVQTAFGATADWLLNQEPAGLWVEIQVEQPDQLKGKALDDALVAAGLPKSGNVDEKRARLAAYNDEQLGLHVVDEDDVDVPPTDPGQDQ